MGDLLCQHCSKNRCCGLVPHDNGETTSFWWLCMGCARDFLGAVLKFSG